MALRRRGCGRRCSTRTTLSGQKNGAQKHLVNVLYRVDVFLQVYGMLHDKSFASVMTQKSVIGQQSQENDNLAQPRQKRRCYFVVHFFAVSLKLVAKGMQIVLLFLQSNIVFLDSKIPSLQPISSRPRSFGLDRWRMSRYFEDHQCLLSFENAPLVPLRTLSAFRGV